MRDRLHWMHHLYALFREKAGAWAPGYVLALGSAAAVAATSVIRKTISTEVNPATFSVWWYGIAGVYAWIWVLLRGDAHTARGIRTGWRPTLVLVLANASAAILFYTEIDLANPALVSFFGRLRTVYVVLLGVFYLGERLNRLEWMGAVVTVLGTLLVAYRGGAVLNFVFVLALIENLLMAVATIMAKSAVRHVPPLVLVGYRGVLISLAVLLYATATGQWQWVSGRTWVVMATGALAGPFLGHVMYYAALAHMDAGKVAVVTALQPVFVATYTALLFGDLPTFQQSLGGALTIAGVIIVFGARYRQPQFETVE
jgi:drug/metabolite transporter (DMT)-like permease